MATSTLPPLDDATRLSEPLVSLPSPLTVVGHKWVFDQPVTLRTTHTQWLRSLSVKNEATGAKLAKIKHSLSATMFINPDIEPFATYLVYDGQDKNAVLTVQRESSSSTYEVHNGVLHVEDGVQPPLFAVTVTTESEDGGKTSRTTSELVVFRDANSGEAFEATVDGDCREDRVALVRVRKVGADQWTTVARIHRPKPKLLQAEYYTLEIASGVDAMFVVMAWLARWGEFQREKPQLKSYTVWTSAPWDLTKQEHVEKKPAPTWSTESAAHSA